MTSFYVRQSDGADVDDGLTWANAKATLSGAITATLAGDSIYADKALVTSLAASTTLTIPGTIAAPVKIVSVNSSGNPQPPTLAETGAVLETSGNFSLTVNGSAYFYGMTFRAGAGSTGSSATFKINNTDNNHQRYENCVLHSASTATINIDIGANSSSIEGQVELRNTDIIFGAATHKLRPYMRMRWDGGSLGVGTAAVTTLFNTGTMGADVLVTGVDLSRAASTLNLVETAVLQYGQIAFRNCKLPASWTGKLLNGDPSNTAFRAIMHNCSSGSTMYPLWEEDMVGKVVHEENIVRAGGASDGSAAFSHKITTKAVASYPTVPFNSPELPAKWNATVGSPVTVSVEILADAAANLTNEEVWLEVQYYSSTDAKTTFISSSKAQVMAAAQTVTASTANWTATGVANPKKQLLSVTFTPQKAGFIQGRVCVAKPNATVFYDPRFIVS